MSSAGSKSVVPPASGSVRKDELGEQLSLIQRIASCTSRRHASNQHKLPSTVDFEIFRSPRFNWVVGYDQSRLYVTKLYEHYGIAIDRGLTGASIMGAGQNPECHSWARVRIFWNLSKRKCIVIQTNGRYFWHRRVESEVQSFSPLSLIAPYHWSWTACLVVLCHCCCSLDPGFALNLRWGSSQYSICGKTRGDSNVFLTIFWGSMKTWGVERHQRGVKPPTPRQIEHWLIHKPSSWEANEPLPTVPRAPALSRASLSISSASMSNPQADGDYR